MFFEDGDRIFPEFVKMMLADYKIHSNKFHVAGPSNGGIAALHIAAAHPQYFLSVTGFPGYLPDATPERVAALAKMCIYLHVGELDSGWVSEVQQQASMFRAKGYKVTSTIEKNEGHVMRTLAGPGAARLFNEMEEADQRCH